MTASSRHTISVTTAHRGERIDRFLATALDGVSRTRAQALIADGQVVVDGKVVQSSRRLSGHETVEVVVTAAAPSAVVPEALGIKIIYEDADIVVINKAAGMVVHPGAGHHSGTLANALLHHVQTLATSDDALRPGLVHRLDKDTSGLLIVAKNDESLRALQAAFKAGQVKKTYVAIVFGVPPNEGTFRTLYGRHPRHRTKFSSKVTRGKEAITHFRVTHRLGDFSRVEVDLQTGRTHQIRVHFSDAGFPLLSDEVYGSKKSLRVDSMKRQALHAWKISFPHPRTARRVRFTAPIPADFSKAQKRLSTMAQKPK